MDTSDPSKGIEAFTQAMEPVYKNLLLLLTIFIILAFGVYISYILNENKNQPIYLSENSFDLFLNKSNINSVTSSTTINNVTVEEFNTLGQYADIDFCPQGQCSVNLSTGIKICPSTITDNSSNNTNQISVTYNKGLEVCTNSDSCPSQLPYAIRNDGSAFDNNCDSGQNCYCTAQPQCATRVVKYFQNEENQPNFSFVTTGDKIDNNFLNNIVIQNNNQSYCQLNPSFTDKIIDGCNFSNKWNDPLGCQYTNIYNSLADTTFVVDNYASTISKFKNLAGVSLNTTSGNFTKGLNFLGIYPKESITTEDLFGIINQTGVFKIGNDSYIYKDSEIIGTNILLNKIGSYDGNNFVPGLPAISQGSYITVTSGFLSNCQNNSNDNVNFKNMLTCVQPYNQPCTDGILSYNSSNPRNFCQGSGLSLSLSNINDFFLINPAYYTLSCVKGGGCDDGIDTTLCISSTDCTNAFENKLEKLFPEKDLSALTNLFTVEPASYGISFIPIISGNQYNFNITNNLIKLEQGDYWELNNNITGIFLTSNSKVGSNIINVNNSSQLTEGMSINFSSTFQIKSITGTSIYLSANLNSFDTSIAKTGFEIITYSSVNYFGTVSNLKNQYNKQNFQLFDIISNKLIDNNNLNIENNYITFYKQFGFNGLNYNTYYDTITNKRKFGNDYFYKQFDNTIEPPFTLFELLQQNINNVKINGLLNETANFKQKYSMYYPVFNEEYFRQECIYCSPSLNAFTYIDDNNGINLNGPLKGVNIQFSGQDYYHYAFGNINNSFKYNQISFGLTAISKNKLSNLSNCSTIVLNTPISGLEIGDYIIDQSGYLNKLMIDSNNNNINGNFKMFDLSSGTSSIPDDKFLPYRLNNTIFKPPSTFDLDSTKASFIENVFYGKAYSSTQVDNVEEYYIRPTIQITKISSDRKTIYTNSPSIHPILDKTIIQFISAKNTLEVDVIQDPEDTFKATGGGAELQVESIALGRIINLKINNQGQGYSTLNRPIIYISKFSPDTSLLNIST